VPENTMPSQLLPREQIFLPRLLPRLDEPAEM
jgi:hypothetical protein